MVVFRIAGTHRDIGPQTVGWQAKVNIVETELAGLTIANHAVADHVGTHPIDRILRHIHDHTVCGVYNFLVLLVLILPKGFVAVEGDVGTVTHNKAELGAGSGLQVECPTLVH